MKKLLSLLLLAIMASTLQAQAPELKNMMPNSWQKLSRLEAEEEREFLEEVDIEKYYTFENYGNELIKSEKIYTQIYKEKCNDLEIYRILSSTVTIEEALQVTVTDGTYTDEEKDKILDRAAISEIDFLREGNEYTYIASTKYGFTAGFQKGFGHEYGNIMYRAKSTDEVGVFITVGTSRFDILFYGLDENKFVFRKCKNQVKGYAECLYYDIKDLLEGQIDKYIRIESSDYLFDPQSPLKYSIQNAFDGNPATSYVENTEDDLMKLSFPGYGNEYLGSFTISLINGYASNENLYLKNNRVKKIDIVGYQLNDSKTELIERNPKIVEFKDRKLNYQLSCIDFLCFGPFYFKISGIYHGSSFNDTCIAEINFFDDINKNWLFGEIDE